MAEEDLNLEEEERKQIKGAGREFGDYSSKKRILKVTDEIFVAQELVGSVKRVAKCVFLDREGQRPAPEKWLEKTMGVSLGTLRGSFFDNWNNCPVDEWEEVRKTAIEYRENKGMRIKEKIKRIRDEVEITLEEEAIMEETIETTKKLIQKKQERRREYQKIIDDLLGS